MHTMVASSIQFPLAFLLLASSILSVKARQKGDYPSYEGDGVDVLRNLVGGNSYEEVYIQYHGCV
jgi:hypothetical protein